jgi:hypothetical protein
MGNVTPVLEDSRILLIGRGHNPNFSVDGWRKITNTLTQAPREPTKTSRNTRQALS